MATTDTTPSYFPLFPEWKTIQGPVTKGRMIVETDVAMIDPCDGLRQEERDIQRAILIAATPRMYRALHEIINLMDNYPDSTGDECAAIARSALAMLVDPDGN